MGEKQRGKIKITNGLLEKIIPLKPHNNDFKEGYDTFLFYVYSLF